MYNGKTLKEKQFYNEMDSLIIYSNRKHYSAYQQFKAGRNVIESLRYIFPNFRNEFNFISDKETKDLSYKLIQLENICYEEKKEYTGLGINKENYYKFYKKMLHPFEISEKTLVVLHSYLSLLSNRGNLYRVIEALENEKQCFIDDDNELKELDITYNEIKEKSDKKEIYAFRRLLKDNNLCSFREKKDGE